MNRYLIFITLMVLNACNSPEKDVIKRAGKKGVELQKVLDHYSDNESDSLKYRSAKFLIENMLYHYGVEQTIFYSGKPQDTFNLWEYGRNNAFDEESLSTHARVLDSLQVRINKGEATWDIESITAEMLIENIDYAFKAWEMPWCKKLSFEQFCEYILPYRSQTEPLTRWRRYFFEKYSWIRDSLSDDSNALEACMYLQNILKDQVFFSTKYSGLYSGFLPPKMFEKIKVGTCENLACYGSLVMRSVGIPVVYDQVLYWKKQNVGHAFNYIITNDSVQGYIFSIIDGNPHLPGFPDISRKVMRKTYKIQNNPLWDVVIRGGRVAPGLSSTNQIDVTDIYCITDTLIMKLPESEKSAEPYWLCQINKNEQIAAVNYSFLKKDKTLCFPKTTINVTYILGKYNHGRLTSIGQPFFYNGQSIQYGVPNMDSLKNYKFDKKIWVPLKHKKHDADRTFNVAYWNKGWVNIITHTKLIDIIRKKYNEGYRDVFHYEIQLTDVPKDAFLMIDDDMTWFTFNKKGFYQEL